ncbi:MAG: hypothetical protein WED04_04130 [Promethearchaeati archaeon SRVP18_Atabeyarchaeia-1]
MSDSQPPRSGGAVRGVRIIFVIIGLICLFFGLPYLYAGIETGDYIAFILGFFLFSLFFSFLSAARSPPRQTPIFRTVTVLKCSKCEYTEVRDFLKGDYVYKNVGKCKDCDGEMFVRSIYTVPAQKTQLSPS